MDEATQKHQGFNFAAMGTFPRSIGKGDGSFFARIAVPFKFLAAGAPKQSNKQAGVARCIHGAADEMRSAVNHPSQKILSLVLAL